MTGRAEVSCAGQIVQGRVFLPSSKLNTFPAGVFIGLGDSLDSNDLSWSLADAILA
jgi:hypothetical protein